MAGRRARRAALGGERAHGCGRHGRRRGWRRCDGRDRRGSGARRSAVAGAHAPRGGLGLGTPRAAQPAVAPHAGAVGPGEGPSSPPRGAYRRPPPPSAMWRARRCAELRPGAAQPGAAASGSSRSAHGRPTAASRDLCGYCNCRWGATSPTRFSSRSRVVTTCSAGLLPHRPPGGDLRLRGRDGRLRGHRRARCSSATTSPLVSVRVRARGGDLHASRDGRGRPDRAPPRRRVSPTTGTLDRVLLDGLTAVDATLHVEGRQSCGCSRT